MTHLPYTDAFLRQRKFYLALPILVLPFLSFIYWKLIVVSIENKRADSQSAPGLQLVLPAADLSGEKNMDKLAYYRKADQDSASRAQQIKKDPYRQQEYHPAAGPADSVLLGLGAPGVKPNDGAGFDRRAKAHSRHQAKVHQRLAALDKALAAAQPVSFEDGPDGGAAADDRTEIAKLEEMMTGIHAQDIAQEKDPEMAQLDSMLSKVLLLQEREKNDQQPAGTPAWDHSKGLPVSVAAPGDPVTLLSAEKDTAASSPVDTTQSAFWGLDQDSLTQRQTGLTAVIDHAQQLIPGATVQLRLTSPVSVAATLIPENTLVYGTASISGERLKIKISSLRAGDKILAVSLSVYDLDGIEGIYIPGALSRTVAKQQLASQLQGYDLDTGGFSLGAQAASAGVQMGKMLLGKKARLPYITIQQGYKVLLYDASPINQ